MKTTLLAILALVPLAALATDEPENTLEAWSREYLRGSQNLHSPISLTAILKMREGEPFLSFRLTNISHEPIQLYPSMLPWGNPSSICLSAFTPQGVRFQNSYPIADPADDSKKTIRPGQTLEGDYRLSDGLDLGAISKDRDVVIMWCYLLFVNPENPMPVSTGVVVIPRAK